MTNPDIIGWLGNILFVYGVYSVSKKKTIGLYSCTIANLLYVIMSLLVDNVPLFWLSILLAGINIYGIYNWSKKDGKI